MASRYKQTKLDFCATPSSASCTVQPEFSEEEMDDETFCGINTGISPQDDENHETVQADQQCNV